MPESDQLSPPAPQAQGSGAGATGQIPGAASVAAAASERIVDLVDKVRARTTLKVMVVLRAVVYGLVVSIAVITALVLAVLGLVRMWDAYLPLDPLGRRVWLGYVVVGGLVFLAGAALLGWRRAARR
jgi:hypothetical protein